MNVRFGAGNAYYWLTQKSTGTIVNKSLAILFVAPVIVVALLSSPPPRARQTGSGKLIPESKLFTYPFQTN